MNPCNRNLTDFRLRVVVFLILAVLLLPLPAYAFDPPSQGTDNATDVILWHGDNATVTITGLTDAIDDAAATQASTHGDYLSFAIIAFIILMVIWQKSIILYAFGSPAALVYGFLLASGNEVHSTLWVSGVAIALIGIYFLYCIVAEGFDWAKKRSTARGGGD